MPVSISTARSDFFLVGDDFTRKHDYLSNNPENTVWDGLARRGDQQSADRIFPGKQHLTLASAGINRDGNVPYGPFIYKDVSGNFFVEVEVSAFTGLGSQILAGNIDAGVMVRIYIPLSSTQELL
jgi:hypothetical protein